MFAPMQLATGQNISISRQSPATEAVVVTVGWAPAAPGVDPDASAFLLARTGKVRGDGDFVFYNNPRTPEGAVVRDGRVFTIDLSSVPGDIDRIAITLTTGQRGGKSFSNLSNISAELADSATRASIARYDSPTTGMSESALIVAEVYRHKSEWKFRATGQGFVGGLAPLATHFGVDVAEDAHVPPPTASPPSPPPPSSTRRSAPPSSLFSASRSAPHPAPPSSAKRQPSPSPSPTTTSSHGRAAQEKISTGLSWLRTRFNEVKSEVAAEVTKFRNREMMEAVVAGCTMIAYADGVVTPDEKQKMVGFMRQSDALKVFGMDQVIASYNKYAGKFDHDPQMGQAEALRAIAKLRGKEGEARLLVRVCCAIGAADGTFDDNEKESTKKICHELGVDPAEFDL